MCDWCCVQVKERELERLLRALDSSKAAEAELTVAGGDALEGARRMDADLAAVGVILLRGSMLSVQATHVINALKQFAHGCGDYFGSGFGRAKMTQTCVTHLCVFSNHMV